MMFTNSSVKQNVDHTLVVTGWENEVRSVASALAVLNWYLEKMPYSTRVEAVLKDRRIVFTGGQVKGTGESEARKMYRVFRETIEVEGGGNWMTYDFSQEDLSQSNFPVTINGRQVMIYLEEQAVDTNTNAEYSVNLLEQEKKPEWERLMLISVLSSDFHVRRVLEAMDRAISESNLWWRVWRTRSLSAEKILQEVAGGYEGCADWRLADQEKWRVWLPEWILRIWSRFSWVREKLRDRQSQYFESPTPSDNSQPDTH